MRTRYTHPRAPSNRFSSHLSNRVPTGHVFGGIMRTLRRGDGSPPPPSSGTTTNKNHDGNCVLPLDLWSYLSSTRSSINCTEGLPATLRPKSQPLYMLETLGQKRGAQRVPRLENACISTAGIGIRQAPTQEITASPYR